MFHEQQSVNTSGEKQFSYLADIQKGGKKSVAVDCFHKKVQFHFIMCILRGLVLLWKRGTQARGNIMTIISTNVMKN